MKVKKVKKEDFLVKSLKKEAILIKNKSSQWLCLTREFELPLNVDIELLKAVILWGKIKANKVSLSNNNDFILDYNGIDNFIFAEKLSFSDELVRNIARELLICESGKYMRFGASGMDKNKERNGGEVAEFQLLNSNEMNGWSSSIMGYVDFEKKIFFSKKWTLYKNGYMSDDRVVYSHTAWIKQNQNSEKGIYLKIQVFNDINILDEIVNLTRKIGFVGYGCIIGITNFKGHNKIKIKGRVLITKPTKKLENQQDATRIAVEKEFFLPAETCFKAYGTFYPRYEPEWMSFTGGRPYERRGHYHGIIIGESLQNVHEVFHLRDLIAEKGSEISLNLYPVKRAMKVYPLIGDDTIASNHRDINEFLKEKDNSDISKYLTIL